MANLVEKKLSRTPIGTYLELMTNSGKEIHGFVTNNDFTGYIEVTDAEGNENVLGYAMIMGIPGSRKLEAIMKELPIGARVHFAYGGEEFREPDLYGVVADNDNQESLEITTDDGADRLLNYSMIRCLLVVGGKTAPAPAAAPAQPAPQPKAETAVPLYMKKPNGMRKYSDGELKELFDGMPREDKRRLNGAFDSFRDGVKNTDPQKMKTAATKAQQIMFDADDNEEYIWSEAAALFCGQMLHRVKIYDEGVFLLGPCYREAAMVCFREQNYTYAGAYALLAMLQEDACPEDVEDLLIVLAVSTVKQEDVSGLRQMHERMKPWMEPYLATLCQEAFANKSIQSAPGQPIEKMLATLGTLYPNNEIGEEVEYWLPEEEETTQEAEQPKAAEPPKPAGPAYIYGTITSLSWTNNTGTITADDGAEYSFRYADVEDAKLHKTIAVCFQRDLDGKVYFVRFVARGRSATEINGYDIMNRVHNIRVGKENYEGEERYVVAYNLCKKALLGGNTAALVGLIENALATNDLETIKEAIGLYEQNKDLYPKNDGPKVIRLAVCYQKLGNYAEVMRYGDRAVSDDNLNPSALTSLLVYYMTICEDCYEATQNTKWQKIILEKTNVWEVIYRQELRDHEYTRNNFLSAVLPRRVLARCILDEPLKAEEELAMLSEETVAKFNLREEMKKAKKRLNLEDPVEEEEQPAAEAEPAADVETVPEAPAEEPVQQPAAEISHYQEDIAETEDLSYPESEEIKPYADEEGWPALGLTKSQVVEYALNIAGEERIPAILTYLRAGAMLCPDIKPVYLTLALAANDAVLPQEYSVDSLSTALLEGDADYGLLNDYCLAAAFLRTCFQVNDSNFVFNAKGLQESVAVIGERVDLNHVLALLEQFRTRTGQSMDLYSDYRSYSVNRLREEREQIIRDATELYDKYVLTYYKDPAFLRYGETRRLVFAQNGLLAVMLERIMKANQQAMEDDRKTFVERYLGGVSQFSAAYIDQKAVEKEMDAAFEQTGKLCPEKKKTATLQGGRRNNLSSAINDVLGVVCRWYQLCEQDSDLNCRNDAGEKVYAQMRDDVMSGLDTLRRNCLTDGEASGNNQVRTGMFLLAQTAGELYRRLEGTWKLDWERFMYVDFLRSDNIWLGKDFMPDLTGSFCALPAYNILARIRAHVEGEKRSMQERLEDIYSPNVEFNDYGTAQQITEYLQATGDAVPDREKAEEFVEVTAQKAHSLYRCFVEEYAHDRNSGRIMQDDTFCCNLENTVAYWYAISKSTRNYGMFAKLLTHAKERIRIGAAGFEAELVAKLEKLKEAYPKTFEENPVFAEAIEEQIRKQNFIAAEDFMRSVPSGGLSMEVILPDARKYLNHFLESHAVNLDTVTQPNKSFAEQMGFRRGKAQEIVDNWPVNGSADRVCKLLARLGWQGLQVTREKDYADAEIYRVEREENFEMLNPVHPIAAFGSKLSRDGMLVASLEGCDPNGLFEKIRALDTLGSNVVILLDFALGSTERRKLANMIKVRGKSLQNVFLVVDRVVICHLVNIYDTYESVINRVLMAIAMPYSYYQPFVVESVLTMPPEMFIGRQEELADIERADGVNLIYGGRQLGKSALFKKARIDIDGSRMRRAVLVDIKDTDCAGAAHRLSAELADVGILEESQVTDDWEALCRSITQRLRNHEDKISYLLVMLDEADTFIEACAEVNYKPITALKSIQQAVPDQFKFVLAGLHSVVRFNRDVALGRNSVITHLASRKITPFRPDEAKELLTLPLSYLGFHLPSVAIVSHILSTANYFPGLIQLFGQKLVESVRTVDYAGYDVKKTPPYDITERHLRQVLKDPYFEEQILEKFEITLRLDQDQGSCYYPLALVIGLLHIEDKRCENPRAAVGYTAADVLEFAREMDVCPLADLELDRIEALLQELQDLNILQASDNGGKRAYLMYTKRFYDLLGGYNEMVEKLTQYGRDS